ncbi:energy transducer TonB [uncultured Marixanthomonas sp.]|uniref:energy transducer TonB n=1 Tax=uncultured Marixanthomonas sp. TaxID=757245 RepID=UPI0030D8008E|tara:strand:+ start:372 stop:1163 length:792 start_codon:yes stop_codon:yes gene_type:complete
MKSSNEQQVKNISKRADKKSINIPWNSGLFFQLGIIVSMALVFFIAESSIGSTTISKVPDNDFYLSEPAMMDFVVEEPIKELPKPKQTPIQKPKRPKIAVIKNTIKVVDNTTPTITETPTAGTDSPIINVPTSHTSKPSESKKKYFANTVEFVPIFPGCEALKTNKERVACFSSKIKTFINKNFKTEQFSGAIDNGEVHRIDVQFQINAAGKVTEIKARSKYQPFEKEAIRVINKLPVIIPGKQGDRSVDVLYNVPIVFKMGY